MQYEGFHAISSDSKSTQGLSHRKLLTVSFYGCFREAVSFRLACVGGIFGAAEDPILRNVSLHYHTRANMHILEKCLGAADAPGMTLKARRFALARSRFHARRRVYDTRKALAWHESSAREIYPRGTCRRHVFGVQAKGRIFGASDRLFRELGYTYTYISPVYGCMARRLIDLRSWRRNRKGKEKERFEVISALLRADEILLGLLKRPSLSNCEIFLFDKFFKLFICTHKNIKLHIQF